MRSIFFAFISLAVLSALGCTNESGTFNIGVEPVLRAEQLTSQSRNAKAIVEALRADAASIGSSPASYYDATVAGFNFVDDQCAAYFNRLFNLNRRRTALKGGLSAFNRTTNAILAVTQASTLSMAIVAQAFGISIEMVDIVSGTYLYELPPSVTLGFVKKTRAAYRQGAAEIAESITNPAESYHQIQSYLALCQPPNIEAMLAKHVANAAGIPVSDANTGQVQVVVSSTPTVDELELLKVFDSAQQQFDPRRERDPNIGAKSKYEELMSRARIATLQKSLCIDPDGVLGPETREALAKFLHGAGVSRSGIHETGMLASDMSTPQVSQLITFNKTGSICATVNNDPTKLGERYRGAPATSAETGG